MSVVGRVYLLTSDTHPDNRLGLPGAPRVRLHPPELVTVIAAGVGWGRGGPSRNVLISRADGRLVVRPFRGLRTPPSLRRSPR